MVFSSHLFIYYFLPVALLGYYAAPGRLRPLLLTLMSYVFYGWANPAFVLLMLFSTAVDYVLGLAIAADPAYGAPEGHRSTRQRIALLASIVTNLGLLGFFKYFNFGVDSYNQLVSTLGWDQARWDTLLRITLPLGISFYTFQSMSYTIDIYRGEAKPVRNFITFACYVSMFPQLVAGPIVRFREVADQLAVRTHTLEKFARGVAFFGFGLAKKVLLANPCGTVADWCFDAGSRGIVEAWYGLFAYAFQIYFDFSAYSDMAIGLGLMLGFVFPKNFDSPYKSRSITEFWRRWHLSLSFFLRDYLYVVLGGNRHGAARTYANLVIVMLAGGLWHGASWNFVLWGGIHGGLLALERLRGKRGFFAALPPWAACGLTFLLTTVPWVFFRAPDLSSAIQYLTNLVGFGPASPAMYLLDGILYQPYYLLVMIAATAVAFAAPQTWDFTRYLTWPKAVWCLALMVAALALLAVQSYNPFIYFIF
jgi:alginate O-acetyltransferase complex protein AlgI